MFTPIRHIFSPAIYSNYRLCLALTAKLYIAEDKHNYYRGAFLPSCLVMSDYCFSFDLKLVNIHIAYCGCDTYWSLLYDVYSYSILVTLSIPATSFCVRV